MASARQGEIKSPLLGSRRKGSGDLSRRTAWPRHAAQFSSRGGGNRVCVTEDEVHGESCVGCNLRRVQVTGERLTQKLVEDWARIAKRISLYNLYSQAETSGTICFS